MPDFKITDDIFNLLDIYEWLQYAGVDEDVIRESFYDKGWKKQYDEIQNENRD
jgi:hypothetical protein